MEASPTSGTLTAMELRAALVSPKASRPQLLVLDPVPDIAADVAIPGEEDVVPLSYTNAPGHWPGDFADAHEVLMAILKKMKEIWDHIKTQPRVRAENGSNLVFAMQLLCSDLDEHTLVFQVLKEYVAINQEDPDTDLDARICWVWHNNKHEDCCDYGGIRERAGDIVDANAEGEEYLDLRDKCVYPDLEAASDAFRDHLNTDYLFDVWVAADIARVCVYGHIALLLGRLLDELPPHMAYMQCFKSEKCALPEEDFLYEVLHLLLFLTDYGRSPLGKLGVERFAPFVQYLEFAFNRLMKSEQHHRELLLETGFCLFLFNGYKYRGMLRDYIVTKVQPSPLNSTFWPPSARFRRKHVNESYYKLHCAMLLGLCIRALISNVYVFKEEEIDVTDVAPESRTDGSIGLVSATPTDVVPGSTDPLPQV